MLSHRYFLVPSIPCHVMECIVCDNAPCQLAFLSLIISALSILLLFVVFAQLDRPFEIQKTSYTHCFRTHRFKPLIVIDVIIVEDIFIWVVTVYFKLVNVFLRSWKIACTSINTSPFQLMYGIRVRVQCDVGVVRFLVDHPPCQTLRDHK